MHHRRLDLVACAVLGLFFAACGRAPSPPALSPLPFPTDTARVERLAPGVWYRYLYSPAGPWAIHVLDVDLSRCNHVVVVKGADTAAGRTKTTDLLAFLARRTAQGRVVAGVNADFFVVANGTPIGLVVIDGRVLTPPTAHPVLAADSAGRLHIATFSRGTESLSPFFPREAVGGHPRLLRDSAVVSDVDTDGGAGFTGRNPRTAAGVGRDGRRLLLAVVDGRQKPYSDGMSLRELANLLRALGARDAVNLDGGGSSTLAYAESGPGATFRVANHPSDAQGERAVGDALAIVNACLP